MNKISSEIYKSTTNSQGEFVFKALPIGPYVISVDALDLKDNATGATVVKGKNAPLKIKVEKR